jgi:oxygen-independent coproporphyrinogen-3 oxidase
MAMQTETTTFELQSARAALIARYDGRAPRYTSYPTAVQFTPDVDEAVYRAWLNDLPSDEPLSLYLHIPFCARLCWYCGCNSRVVRRRETIASYVRLLTAEIGLLAEAQPAPMTVSAVHLGGGSPNALAPGDIGAIFAALEGAFRLAPDMEVAAELDPTGLTRDWVAAAAARGLTRASLGVQALAPQVQRAVNRADTLDNIADAMAWLRAAGVASINLDLMYGLPHQSVENTLATLDQVLPLRPERLALFGYAHVPWMKAHQRLIDEAALPGPAERLAQSEEAEARILADGYERIGLDHFALPGDSLAIAQAEGRLRRNFQGYTTDQATTLLGLGASAIGALPGGYVQNLADEVAWRAAVGEGRLPIARGVAFTADDRLRGEIIGRLMCEFAVDLAAVCARHGVAVEALAPELARLDSFVDDGLVCRDGPRLTVTETGRRLVRSIAAVFDAYLRPDATRHSRAI